MAAHLGLDEYAVFGLSGGGPFAVATAVADPGHVRALGVVGGIGPWRLIDDDLVERPRGEQVPRSSGCGDVAGAWDCMRRDVDRAYGGLDRARRRRTRRRDPGRHRRRESLVDDEAYRAIWADNMRVVLDSFDGIGLRQPGVGSPWDVDPRDVAAPTLLWYGESDTPCPPAHGRWYADRIAGSELVIFPGEAHLDVIDGHWPEVLAGLLGIWSRAHSPGAARGLATGHDRTPPPPSDGVLWPDEPLTSSSAGRHSDHRSRAPPIVPSPQASRDVM